MAIFTLGVQESFKQFVNNSGSSTEPVNMAKYVSDRFGGKLTVNISAGTSVSNSYVSSAGTNDNFLQVINNAGPTTGRGGSYQFRVAAKDQKGKVVLGCRIRRTSVTTPTVYLGGYFVGPTDYTVAASAATEAYFELEADFEEKKMSVYLNGILVATQPPGSLPTGGHDIILVAGSHPWTSGKGYALNEAASDTCRLSDGYVSVDLPEDPNPTGRLGPIILDFSPPANGSSGELVTAGQATATNVGTFSATPATITTEPKSLRTDKQPATYRPGMQVAMVAFEIAAGKSDPTSPSTLEMTVLGGPGPDYKTATKNAVFNLGTVIRTPGQLVLKPEDFEGGLDLRELFFLQLKSGR